MSSRSKIGNAIGIFACVCLVVFSTCRYIEGRIGRRWWRAVSELQPSAYLPFT